MKPHPLVSVLAVAGLAASAFGADPDPQEIAERCILATAARATHRVERNGQLAAECVETIEELLDDGHTDAAAAAARQCINRITNRSQRTSEAIRHRCHDCIAVLRELGAPGLAHAVKTSCEQAVGAVQASRRRSVLAILEALAGDGESSESRPAAGPMEPADVVQGQTQAPADGRGAREAARRASGAHAKHRRLVAVG